MDITSESKETLEAYGASPGEASFANNCLLARRLVEQGVRFVQLFDWGWDFHGTGPDEDIRDGLTKKCATMDKPIAALIKDLKQRGLLDDTLIIWGGEFGRTPFREGRTSKRQRPGPRPLSRLLHDVAGRRRRQAAATATASPTSSASASPRTKSTSTTCKPPSCTCSASTTRGSTYRFQGRDYRLTDVHGHVVKELLA